MATAETGRTSLAYAVEAAWGEVPAPGSLKELRFTGESLAVSRQTAVSDEVRDDRQITDLVATRVEAQGGIDGEFSLDTYDDFLAGALFSDWVDIDATLDDVTIAAVAGEMGNYRLTLPNGHGSGLRAGIVVRLSSFAAATNNAAVEVYAADDANTFRVRRLDGAAMTPVVDAQGVDFAASYLCNGVTQQSFHIQKNFKDVAKVITYRGMVVGGFSLSMEAESIVGMSLSFTGRRGVAADAGEVGGAVDAATTTSVLNAGDHVAQILDAGDAVSPVRNLTLEIENNLRTRPAVSQGEGIGIGAGRFSLTGTLSTYFENFELYQQYQDNTESALRFTLRHPTEGVYVVSLPRIKLSEMNIQAGGADQDVLAEGSYQALRDPTLQVTMCVSKVASQ